MSSFLSFSGPLDTRYDAEASVALGKDHWRILTPFRFYLGGLNSERWVYVPAGYLTDGASVPQFLWDRIPPWGRHGQAAVVHDILCEYLTLTNNGVPEKITRKECDRVLHEAMVVLGVEQPTRFLVKTGVDLYRIFSGTHLPSATPLKRELEANWPGV